MFKIKQEVEKYLRKMRHNFLAFKLFALKCMDEMAEVI